jgi:hypothetical protein
MFPSCLFYFFLDAKSNKKFQEKLLGSAGEVLCTSFELLDYGRGAGGVLFGCGISLFFSINEPFTHSFIAHKKKGIPLSPPISLLGNNLLVKNR